MRIKNGYTLKEIGGQTVVVAKNGFEPPKNAIALTETAVFLWKLLENGNVSKGEMLNALLDAFEISTVLALGNIDVFLRTMRESGLIEE